MLSSIDDVISDS